MRSQLANGLIISTAIAAMMGGLVYLLSSPETSASAARNRELADILSIEQSPRIDRTPGVTAWLKVLLNRACVEELPIGQVDNCLSFISPSEELPRPLEFLQDSFRKGLQGGSLPDNSQLGTKTKSLAVGRMCLSEYRNAEDQVVVITRPGRFSLAAGKDLKDKSCEEILPNEDKFIKWAGAVLMRFSPDDSIVHNQSAWKGANIEALRALRAYVISPEGMIASHSYSEEEFQVFKSAAEMRGTPSLTTANAHYAPKKSAGEITYTGAYVDVTGHGIVATAYTTLWPGAGSGDFVVAVDIGLVINSKSILISRNDDNIRKKWIDLPSGENVTWKEIADKAETPEFTQIAADCSPTRIAISSANICVAKTTEGGQFAIAIPFGASPAQEHSQRWLISWSGNEYSNLRYVGYALVLASAWAGLAVLISSRSHYKKALKSESRKVHEILDAVKNLKLPIVTIEPSTDRVSYLNHSAKQLGIKRGALFREYVQSSSLPFYDSANTPDGNPRRSYSVELKVAEREESESFWSLITSTTLPRGLSASSLDESAETRERVPEGTRLGLIAPLNEGQLDLYKRVVSAEAKRDERAKLGSLLMHGLRPLILLSAEPDRLEPAAMKWLREALDASIEAIAAIFTGSEAARRSKRIKKEEIVRNLNGMLEVCMQAAVNRKLRKRLYWHNGILGDIRSDTLPFYLELEDWNEEMGLQSEFEGVIEYIFIELINNAMKHGTPGLPAVIRAVTVETSSGQFIDFEFINGVSETAREMATKKLQHRYSGRTIIEAACLQTGYELSIGKIQSGLYSTTLRIKASR